jgi:ubiquinone biosynthesis protein UbiJ
MDATQAVKGLDDVTDSWGLTTKDTSVVMDKMIVSQQKFGGSIQDNLVTLSALAPAMRAANMTVDDGIALLGLFGSKGLDAGQASAAFAKALTKVKSPAELQKLIDDISNTKDPFLRAAKAADLFGAKAGAKLANALGGVNLKDYKIGMDEAADATSHAADVLDSSFGREVPQADVAGPCRAPVVRGGLRSLPECSGIPRPARQRARREDPARPVQEARVEARREDRRGHRRGHRRAGPARGSSPTASPAVEGAGSSSRVTGALSRVGKFLGTGMGQAFAVAFAAAAVLGAFMLADQLDADNSAQQDAIAQAVKDMVTKGTLDGLQQSKAALEQGIKDIQSNTALDIFGLPSQLLGGKTAAQSQIEQLQAQLDAVNAAIAKYAKPAGEHAGKDLMEGVTAGATAAAPNAATSIGNTLAKEFKSHGKAWIASAHAAGNRAMEAVAQGIDAARQKPLDAFDQLKEMLKHELTPMAEQSRLLGELTSKALARGLRSKDPEVKAQAKATKQYIIDRLTELATQTGRLSKKQASMLAQGLKSKDPDIRHAAQRIQAIVTGRLEATVPKAHAAGVNAGNAFANGVRAAIIARMQAGINIHVNPVYSNNGKGNAVGGWATAGVPTWVNEHTTNSEIFVPSTSGRFVTHAEAMNAIGQGGASPINITINAGGDVSPVAAHRFGQLVVHEVAAAFRQGGARRGITTSVRP